MASVLLQLVYDQVSRPESTNVPLFALKVCFWFDFVSRIQSKIECRTLFHQI